MLRIPSVKGVMVGQGKTSEVAAADVKSAVYFHLDTSGPGQVEFNPPILEVFIAETGIAV